MVDESTQAKIGSGILADSAITLDNGKVIAQGLITTFWAWGFPCSRSCTVFTTIFNLSIGTTTLTVTLTDKKGKITRTLVTLDIKNDSDKGATTAVTPLRIEFTEPGEFSILCTLKGIRSRTLIPFIVRQRDWPEFSDEEKRFAAENPNIIHRMRANVQCKNCSHAFIFEESVMDEITPGGVNRFPESGQLDCNDCGHVIQLRDIQGQLRAHLKAVFGLAMGGHP